MAQPAAVSTGAASETSVQPSTALAPPTGHPVLRDVEVPVKFILIRQEVAVERRRARLLSPTFGDVKRCARQWACGGFKLQYTDDDGDLVALDLDEEWEECVSLWCQQAQRERCCHPAPRPPLCVWVDLSPAPPQAGAEHTPHTPHTQPQQCPDTQHPSCGWLARHAGLPLLCLRGAARLGRHARWWGHAQPQPLPAGAADAAAEQQVGDSEQQQQQAEQEVAEEAQVQQALQRSEGAALTAEPAAVVTAEGSPESAGHSVAPLPSVPAEGGAAQGEGGAAATAGVEEGTGTAAPAPSAPESAGEATLRQMGFEVTDEIRAMLLAHGGDIRSVLSDLL